jgi:hypothetical protein
VPSPVSSAGVVAATSTTTNTSALQKSFSVLFQTYLTNTMKMDGRVALRRWSSVALVWLCQGQPLVLQAVERLLDNSAHWAPLLESTNSSRDSSSGVVAAAKKDKVTTTTLPAVTLPGNVTVMILTCRLARIVWETGNSCGSRPPTGGLEAYMRAIWPAPTVPAKPSASTKKSASAKSRAGGVKLVRSDVRDLATVVVYKLIQTHNDCLESNLGKDCGLLVVNDFEMLPANLARLPYYPFVHRALDDLARAASSSVPNAIYPEQTEWSNRIDRAAAAFVFQRHRVQDTSLPMDAKLASFAVGKLLESFTQREEEQAGTGSSDAASTLGTEDWRLSEPIPVPQVPECAVKPASASRKKKKTALEATAAKRVCSFAGVYKSVPDGTDTSSNRGLRADEILSLFIRSMEGSDGKERTTELISYVIAIVERCYDTRRYEDLCTEAIAAVPAAASSAQQPQAKKRKLGGPTTRRTKKAKTVGDKEDRGAMPENDSSGGERSLMSAYR